jgi:peptidoglycan/LPS O-acetylase OafA/YrhL
MTLMLREARKSGGIDVGGFLARRILRLWPLYYAILLLEAGLVYVMQVYSPENQALFGDKLACYVLYCSNWLETSGQGPFFVSWSLAVEEQFYLFLSLLLLVFRPAWVAAIFGGLLIAKILLINWARLDPAGLPWRIVLSYSEAIVLGVLLAFLLNNRRSFDWFGRFTAYRSMPAILLLVFCGFLLFGSLEHKSDLPALAFFVVCALLVGVCAVREELPILGGKLLSWIGLVSYGIYLMHMPILSAVKKVTMDPLLVMLLTLMLVLPIAWLSFNFFEEPIRQWGRRRIRTRKPRREGGARPFN